MKKNKLLRRIDNFVNDKLFQMIYKNNTLDIINYAKIVDFSSTEISLMGNNKLYIISGKDLVIAKMMDSEILITGTIINISIK